MVSLLGRDLCIFKCTVLGTTLSRSNSKHLRGDFLPRRRKGRVPDSNPLLGRGWGGSGGHTAHRGIHLESSRWGLPWGGGRLDELFILAKAKKRFDRKLTNDFQKRRSPEQSPQDSARAVLDGETPVPLPKPRGAAGTGCAWEVFCGGFVLPKDEPEPKHEGKYSALLWDFSNFYSWQVIFFSHQVSTLVRVLWLSFLL